MVAAGIAHSSAANGDVSPGAHPAAPGLIFFRPQRVRARNSVGRARRPRALRFDAIVDDFAALAFLARLHPSDLVRLRRPHQRRDPTGDLDTLAIHGSLLRQHLPVRARIAAVDLRDRVQRLSGLFLFLICVLKLFFYDLRQLETINRILSFIVLGLILVSVSWIYTRFRDRIQKYL